MNFSTDTMPHNSLSGGEKKQQYVFKRYIYIYCVIKCHVNGPQKVFKRAEDRNYEYRDCKNSSLIIKIFLFCKCGKILSDTKLMYI